MTNICIKYSTAFTFLLALMSVLPLYGQTIKGRVVDNNNAPVEYVSIIGTLLSDTTQVIASVYSGENGCFVLDCSSHKNEMIRLKISYIGFQNLKIDIPSEYTFATPVVLNEKVLELNEVTVSAYKSAFSMTDGKIGINVNQLILGGTDSFLDILKRIPGIIVSNDGIEVQGNEAIVMIDGVKQRMPMNILLNYLKSQSASELKKIYIKTMATAENKLSGEEATIEIFTKKKTTDGYNFSNTIHGMLMRKGAYKFGDYMNLLCKYGDLSGNISVGYARSSFLSEFIETYSSGTVCETLNQRETRNKDAYFGVLNLTWAPRVLNGSLNYFASYYVDDLHCKNKEMYQANETHDHVTDRDIRDWTNLFSTNIEYRSADTLKYQYKISYGLLIGGDDYNQLACKNLNNSSALDKRMKGHRHILETRFTVNLPKFVYTIGYDSYFSGMNECVKSQSKSDFTISEILIGLYTSGRVKFHLNLSTYLGVRAEYAHYKYIESNIISTNKKWNFAPYFTIDWTVCNNFSTNLYLTMKNNRPGYFSMLPGITYKNDKEYSIGNPDLESSMQYDLKIQNLFFNYAIFTLGVRYIDNSFGSIYALDNNGIRFVQPRNYANLFYYYGDLSVPFSFLQGKLKGSIYLYLRNLSYNNVIDDIKFSVFRLKNNWYCNGNIYASYQITKDLNIYINPFFRTRNSLLQEKRKGVMSVDMGIQYSLSNTRWAFALTAEDIFNQLKNESSYIYGKDYQIEHITKPYNQGIRLSITYNLGRDSKNIRVNKNENDISRFKK